MAGGQEWGGGRRATTSQFPPWGREGRFFWPAATDGVEKIEAATVDAIDDAVDLLRRPGRR